MQAHRLPSSAHLEVAACAEAAYTIGSSNDPSSSAELSTYVASISRSTEISVRTWISGATSENCV